jgi:hypothetical protein
VQQEKWDPATESGVVETDTIEAEVIQVNSGVVMQANSEADESLIVSCENLISGWTPGVK